MAALFGRFDTVVSCTGFVGGPGSSARSRRRRWTEDIGARTARIVLAEPQIANERVFVAGDTVTYRQLADTLDRLPGLNVDRAQRSVPELRRQLAGAPDDALWKYRVVCAEGRGVAGDKRRTFNAQAEIAVCTLEDWIRRNAPVATVDV